MNAAASLTSLTRPINVAFLGILLSIVAVTAYFDVTWFLPPVILSGILLFWTYKRPEVWLSLAVLSHVIFLRRTADISLMEILFGVYFFGFLLYWFVRKTIVPGEGLIKERAGAWLFVFLMVSAASVAVGFTQNVVLHRWFREVLTTSTIFVFFPAVEILKTRRGRRLVFGALCVLSVFLAGYNIIMYSSAAAVAEFTYDIVGKRQTWNVHFFYAMVVLTTGILIHDVGTRRFRLGILAVLTVNAVALAASFTRGFWFATAIAIALLFLLAEPRKKLILAASSFVALVVGAAFISIVWGRLGEVILTSLFSRFVSTGMALQDISFTNRLVESAAIFDAVLKTPILGHGYGSSFRYLSLLSGTTMNSWYAHNGYFFLLFKVGVIGLAAFLGFYVIVLWRGFRAARTLSVEHNLRAAVHGVWAILVSMLVVTITSNVFIEREPLFLIGLGAAFLVSQYESLGGQEPSPALKSGGS